MAPPPKKTVKPASLEVLLIGSDGPIQLVPTLGLQGAQAELGADLHPPRAELLAPRIAAGPKEASLDAFMSS